MITSVGDHLLKRGKPLARDRHQRRDHLAVMHVAGRDGEIVQEAERNDGRVPLCTFLRRRAGIEDRYASGQGLTTADPRAKPVDGFVVLLGQVPRSLNRR